MNQVPNYKFSLQYVHLFLQEAENHEGVWSQVMIEGQASRGSATHGKGSMIRNHGCTERFSSACACFQEAETSKKIVYIVPCFLFQYEFLYEQRLRKENKRRRSGIRFKFGHFSIQKTILFPVCSYNGELREAALFCTTMRVAAFPAPIRCSASSCGSHFSLFSPAVTQI